MPPAVVERIEMTPAEYAAVRRDPRRFFVVPGPQHVFPDVEAVIEWSDRYWVVQKLGVAANVAAERAMSGI